MFSGTVAAALVLAACGIGLLFGLPSGTLPTISDAPIPGTLIMIIRHGEQPIPPQRGSTRTGTQTRAR